MADQAEKSVRVRQVEARQARLAATVRKPEVVRVTPRDDNIKKYIKHWPSGIGFPAEGGSAAWPLDEFTRRRIRDGDVTIEKRDEKPGPHPTGARPRPHSEH